MIEQLCSLPCAPVDTSNWSSWCNFHLVWDGDNQLGVWAALGMLRSFAVSWTGVDARQSYCACFLLGDDFSYVMFSLEDILCFS